ncbi:hypothetical protein AOLI_G00158760 [Acnodon oligacanthus]
MEMVCEVEKESEMTKVDQRNERREMGEKKQKDDDLLCYEDPTTMDSMEDEEISAAPEEPRPQPQALSEPQIDTDGSKLSTEEEDEAVEATSSQVVDDLKESVLRPLLRGTTVQC